MYAFALHTVLVKKKIVTLCIIDLEIQRFIYTIQRNITSHFIFTQVLISRSKVNGQSQLSGDTPVPKDQKLLQDNIFLVQSIAKLLNNDLRCWWRCLIVWKLGVGKFLQRIKWRCLHVYISYITMITVF